MLSREVIYVFYIDIYNVYDIYIRYYFAIQTRLSFYIIHILEVVDQLSYIGTCFTFILLNNSNELIKAKKQLSHQGQIRFSKGIT